MVPLDPRERWAPLLSQYPEPVKLQQPDLSPGVQLFATRLSSQTILTKRSSFIPPTLWPDESRPSGITGATFNERRARHIPIIITPEIIQSVLKDLPDSPGTTLDCDHPPSLPTTRETGRDKSAGIRPARRTRHVPIIIPEFAQPDGLFRQTPSTATDDSHSSSPDPVPPSRRIQSTMSRPPTSAGRTSTMNSDVSAPSPTQFYGGRFKSSSSTYLADMNSSQSSLNRDVAPDMHQDTEPSKPLRIAGLPSQSTSASPAASQPNVQGSTPMMGTTNLSGLVCNVHRTTGREPHPLVGATTTILGDKLYVFGGRILSRTRPRLTSDLYELDLLKRHWSKIETTGDIPPPRYFHSVCSLGDTKLVCYGGMSPLWPSTQASGTTAIPQPGSQDSQPEVVVLSDIHIYDVRTRTWMYIPTPDTPQGRYAHCATILPSSAAFASATAPLSAIHNNPSSSNPNQGSIGVALDGSGGAEMVVVGGQDSTNHYIEQISVFNLRSLKWTATNSLGRSCGAYRSVVAPLTGMHASKIGEGPARESNTSEEQHTPRNAEIGSSMMIYSNYNFLDVKLELQVRLPDGTLSEKHMHGQFSPPGLRFPNGGVLDNHFVVSGTYLTSSKQEYALWALDLRSLTWARIDAGGSVFTQGSWNRGVLWSRRNTFVILGNRKRSLVEDYNHRRINFSNICMVELEAFGLYDNPRRTIPMSDYTSVSSPSILTRLLPSRTAWSGGGRPHSTAAEELGQMALGLRELADMDILAIGGERVPVNSHILARRWGPYFVQLLFEGAAPNDGEDAATLRGHMHSQASRNSSITITGSIGTSHSTATTLTNNKHDISNPSTDLDLPSDLRSLPATSRPRTLYLPHTHLTLQTFVHYLYTSALPPPSSPLSTPQILCSLLQLARPYQVDGLLEATIERLHQILDGRNAAAIFNAAAMAAGGGRGVGLIHTGATNGFTRASRPSRTTTANDESDMHDMDGTSTSFAGAKPHGLRINTNFNYPNPNGRPVGGTSTSTSNPTSNPNPNLNASREEMPTSASTTASNGTGSVAGSTVDVDGEDENHERQIPWAGELSAVVGLQKRGLRGLMEGRRNRERGKSLGVGAQLGHGHGHGHGHVGAGGGGGGGGMERGEGRVGLGIA
ncbi:hypothetical protein MMC16_006456 [Acarospora aff. strigata]|nr:hypothetical protein [Acarospora aff. strigata]